MAFVVHTHRVGGEEGGYKTCEGVGSLPGVGGGAGGKRRFARDCHEFFGDM